MALKAPKSNGKSKFKFELVEPDTYPARVVQVIDMGLQPQPDFKGEKKDPKHTIMITYEMSDLFMKDEEGDELEDKPRWFSEKFPLYPLESDRAKSTQRYKAIDPKNKFEGDFSQLIGLPCSIMITQYKKNNGDLANGIGAVSPIMRGMKLPELVNKPSVFLMDDPDMDVFNKFPDWLKDTLKSNLEFEGSALQTLLNGGAPDNKSHEDNGNNEEDQQEEEYDDEENNPWD